MKRFLIPALTKAAHTELFFIVHEDDTESHANKLYKYLRLGLGHFPGLSDFTQIPVQLTDNHITFDNADNPLPEIKRGTTVYGL